MKDILTDDSGRKLRAGKPPAWRADNAKADQFNAFVGETLGLKPGVARRQMTIGIDDAPPRQSVGGSSEYFSRSPRRARSTRACGYIPKADHLAFGQTFDCGSDLLLERSWIR